MTLHPSDNTPLISIITVTYNAAATVGATLQSVASQTVADYEHIIMDGASTDGTLAVVEAHNTDRVRVFSSPDNGIYDAMNKAIGAARGEYLLFLNAGDRFADSKVLERYVNAIEANRRPGVVYGQTVLVDSSDRVLGPRHLEAPRELTLGSFKDGMVVCHQAFMVLRHIAPLYDLRYRYSADYEWCIRCLQHSQQNVYLGEMPVIHYLAEGLTTSNHKASLRERFDIMCFYFGTISTVMRHVKFALRYGRRRKTAVNIQ